MILAAIIVVLELTGTPPIVRLPDPAGLTITENKAFAGLSKESVNGKSVVVKVYGVSSFVVTAWSVPDGGSFTGRTLIVIVAADTDRSIPPLLVPPSSCTRKVKVVVGLPLEFAGGLYVKLAALMLPTVMDAPWLTATPARNNVPEAGRVLIVTEDKAFAGLSKESVNGKSDAVNV